MIHRVFWLTLGAAAGVAGYRRAARLARAVSPAARAAGVARFAADVRDGMELYLERHPTPGASTLGSHRGVVQVPGTPADRADSRTHHTKDGR